MGLMLADAVVVNTELMREKALTAAEKIQKMETALEELEAAVGRTGGYWIGEAANAHRAYFTEKKPEIEEAWKRLKEDVSDLQQMAGIYETGEREAASEAADLPGDVVF